MEAQLGHLRQEHRLVWVEKLSGKINLGDRCGCGTRQAPPPMLTKKEAVVGGVTMASKEEKL